MSKENSDFFSKIQPDIITDDMVVIQWDHEIHPGLVWKIPEKFPNKKDENVRKYGRFSVKKGRLKGRESQSALDAERQGIDIEARPEMLATGIEVLQDILMVDAVLVREYERAVFVKEGICETVMGPGIWQIADKVGDRGSEIIWVNTRRYKTKWGIPKTIVTKDNFPAGAYGTAEIEITEPKNFVTKVVADGSVILGERDSDEAIRKWVKERLASTIRAHFGKFTILELQRELDKLNAIVKAKVAESLGEWGLELIRIDILGIHAPEASEQTTASAVEKARLESEVELERIKTERDTIKVEREGKIRTVEPATTSRAAQIRKRISRLQEEIDMLYIDVDLSEDEVVKREAKILERIKLLEQQLEQESE